MKIKFENISTEEVETMLIELADNMASAAADFSGHGYFQFLEARKSLCESLHQLLTTNIS